MIASLGSFIKHVVFGVLAKRTLDFLTGFVRTDRRFTVRRLNGFGGGAILAVTVL